MPDDLERVKEEEELGPLIVCAGCNREMRYVGEVCESYTHTGWPDAPILCGRGIQVERVKEESDA